MSLAKSTRSQCSLTIRTNYSVLFHRHPIVEYSDDSNRLLCVFSRIFFFTSLTIQPITDHRYYMLYMILVVSRCEIFKALRHGYLLHIMSPVSFRLISKDVGLKTLHTRFLHHQYFPSLTTQPTKRCHFNAHSEER